MHFRCSIKCLNYEFFYRGLQVSRDNNDAEVLMEPLGKCCSCKSPNYAKECSCNGDWLNSVPKLLSAIKGPWALIYRQESSKSIWFGKDTFGRRSLLVHWPDSRDSRLLLSSVSPVSSICKSVLILEIIVRSVNQVFWEELPFGIYSLSIQDLDMDKHLVGEVRNDDWTNLMLRELVNWERSSMAPVIEKISVFNSQDMQSACLMNMSVDIGNTQASVSISYVVAVLTALRKSTVSRDYEEKSSAPVAVLFCGGLDSMILAAILDECLDTKYEIDLHNVSFDEEFAPDRISSRTGLKELCRVAPLRSWKLVEIDANFISPCWRLIHHKNMAWLVWMLLLLGCVSDKDACCEAVLCSYLVGLLTLEDVQEFGKLSKEEIKWLKELLVSDLCSSTDEICEVSWTVTPSMSLFLAHCIMNSYKSVTSSFGSTHLLQTQLV